jgi:CBS-domain-containing membrane protein
MMTRRSLKQEIIYILAAIFFLGLGFLAAWLFKLIFKIEGDAVYVSLLLLPIIVYAIFSGRLKELRAGGLEAKFEDVAEQSVESASETIELSTEEMETVDKRDIGELKQRLQNLDKSKLIILTLTLGKKENNRDVVSKYIEALRQYRNFKFVVILDSENKFVAYITSWDMEKILKSDKWGNEFVRIICEDDRKNLKRYPEVITKTVSTKATNLDALNEMTAQHLEALVVIDENKRLKGVVERDQIQSELLLGMAK